ncbi:mevalonate kinase [Sporosarcina sp. HYO08]|uniref:mevalonate kinase n=1 Tax=Sporosarcina sp. HYO08 TaxID=1759557 RepID=UPI00079B2C60|nr:mevalonate kinase [Sporosarcina sp. HYO08]KXH81738.1 mevalonate kinase [Sporosarcina sp. HYO08]
MSQKIPKTAVGSAHSKLILIGEHAVVYGQPAIALPFSLVGVTATVERHEQLKTVVIESPYYSGAIEEMPTAMLGIADCIKETLNTLSAQPVGLYIDIQSTIPLGRGLGSSAALAIAIVRGLFTYFEQPCSQEELMRLVHIAETYAHGNPSGIDMEAASSDHPIWFQKGRPTHIFHVTKPISLIVADTGRIGDTRAAVEGIGERRKLDPQSVSRSIEKLGQLTIEAKDALSTGDINQLGQVMDFAQHELSQLGVSDTMIDQLVEAARKAGALGAKLTGGGRGGCIIALAKGAQHASQLEQALEQAGASQTWHVRIGEQDRS